MFCKLVLRWLQVVTGESGSSEDREREQLLRRATGLRGSITRAQDRYGAVMDAFKTNEDITLGMGPTQQVCLLHSAPVLEACLHCGLSNIIACCAVQQGHEKFCRVQRPFGKAFIGPS